MNVNSVFHNAHNFNNYKEYTCSEQNGYAYLWDEDDIIGDLKSGYKWEDIFKAVPYIQNVENENSNLFIRAPAFQKLNYSLFIDEDFRKKKYNRFINYEFDPEGKRNSQIRTEARALQGLVQERLDLLITELERIDDHLIKVLKVFCLETEQKLMQENVDSVTLYHFIRAVSDFYQTGIRVICDTEVLVKDWIPYCSKLNYDCSIPEYEAPEAMVRSLKNAIFVNVPEKKKLLKKMLPLVEKLNHLNALLYYIVNDIEQPVTGRNNSQNRLIDLAIEEAVYRKKNSNEAWKFLKMYSDIHSQNKKITNSDAIKKIQPEEQEIHISDRTFAKWISDYIEALERLDAIKK